MIVKMIEAFEYQLSVCLSLEERTRLLEEDLPAITRLVQALYIHDRQIDMEDVRVWKKFAQRLHLNAD